MRVSITVACLWLAESPSCSPPAPNRGPTPYPTDRRPRRVGRSSPSRFLPESARRRPLRRGRTERSFSVGIPFPRRPNPARRCWSSRKVAGGSSPIAWRASTVWSGSATPCTSSIRRSSRPSATATATAAPRAGSIWSSGLGASAVGEPIDDHSGGGIRRGVDGFLYIAVGDRGVPRGSARTVRRSAWRPEASSGSAPTGPGLRSSRPATTRRPDWSLSAGDDVFSFGGGDDRKRWAKSLVHHIVAGRYGYPYQFLNAAFRTLPVVSKLGDGRAGQGVCYNEGGLPESYEGNLILCDPDAQTVHRLEIRKAGGSFALSRRTPMVTRGGVADFHPFALATQADGAGFWLVDQASSRDAVRPSPTGRLYRLTYEGRRPSADEPARRPWRRGRPDQGSRPSRALDSARRRGRSG